MILLYILLGVAALVLLAAYICYRIVFYAKPTAPLGPDEYDIPAGEIYAPYRDKMIQWQRAAREMPYQEFTVTSFDGLKLYARYYECEPGAPIELMFHGYRGTAERDLCGGIHRAFCLKHNVFLVDQRAAVHSEGHVISFGINEHRDCLTWIDFVVEHFGPDARLILSGISMGASTVVMAAGRELPSNVVGVLADCGYTSAEEIIRKCTRQMGLPPQLIYPFIRLGARIFGHFDPNAYSPLEAVKNCKVPVIFYHGEADDFVPCDMSVRVYENCPSPKRLVTTPGAGHGLCYLIDPKGYLDSMAEFFTENGVETAVQPQ